MSETKKFKKVPPQALRRQLLTIFPVYLNAFITGITYGWISNAIYLFHKGDPEPFTAVQCSMIASSSEIGCAIFSLPAGYIIDRIGRKTTMAIAGIVHLIAWTILSFFSSYNLIILARFGLGIGSTLVHSACSITIGELSSPEIRAKLTSISQFSLYLGQLFPSLLNILFSSYNIISYTVTIISALYFLSLYFQIETPYSLVNKSKCEMAKANLRIIRIGYAETEIDEEFEKFQKYIEDEKKRKQELNWWEFFCSRKILKPLLITILIHHLVLGMGDLVIMTYITEIIPNDVGFLPRQYYPFVIQFLRISIALCTPFLIEVFPRRVTFLSLTLFSFFNLMLIGTAYYCFAEMSISFCQWIFTMSILFIAGIESGFVLSIISTMRAELLPQAVKGIGASMCIMTISSTNVLYFQLYRFITENYDMYWIFFIFSMNSLVLFFVIYFLFPETRGKFLADIQLEQNEELAEKKGDL